MSKMPGAESFAYLTAQLGTVHTSLAPVVEDR